ncbi:MAG: hypothetical protein ABSF94_04290 [Steroidobacteraceae bacterium]|jgi:hypothetical protein
MGNLDLNDDKRTAADVAADTNGVCLVPGIAKPKPNPDTALHLDSEGDTLEQDDLEIDADPLPVFDTHASRHLG